MHDMLNKFMQGVGVTTEVVKRNLYFEKTCKTNYRIVYRSIKTCSLDEGSYKFAS